MDLVMQFNAMARYNTWMNRRIYEICAALSDEERKRDLRAFFGSIHRTLNHLLLTDRVQLGRFIGKDRTQTFDHGGKAITINSLDQELYANFDLLRREREKTDAMVEAWTNEIAAEFLASEMVYDAMSAAGRYRVPMWIGVAGFFNHQTHHRERVRRLLTQSGADPGVAI